MVKVWVCKVCDVRFEFEGIWGFGNLFFQKVTQRTQEAHRGLGGGLLDWMIFCEGAVLFLNRRPQRSQRAFFDYHGLLVAWMVRFRGGALRSLRPFVQNGLENLWGDAIDGDHEGFFQARVAGAGDAGGLEVF